VTWQPPVSRNVLNWCLDILHTVTQWCG